MSTDQYEDHLEEVSVDETECCHCKKMSRGPSLRTADDFASCEHCGHDVHLGISLESWLNNERPAGKKFDQEKTQYHLMPLKALEQTNRVLMHGAAKYGANNWQQVEGWEYRYYNAALRHLFQWQAGEKVDAESGISHLAHAICSLMFLIEKEN